MAVFGLLTVLRRFELRLDLAAETWHRREGFWPNVAADSGPLSDVRAVTVRYRLETKDKGGAAVGCDVALDVTGEALAEPLRYARTQNLPEPFSTVRKNNGDSPRSFLTVRKNNGDSPRVVSNGQKEQHGFPQSRFYAVRKNK